MEEKLTIDQIFSSANREIERLTDEGYEIEGTFTKTRSTSIIAFDDIKIGVNPNMRIVIIEKGENGLHPSIDEVLAEHPEFEKLMNILSLVRYITDKEIVFPKKKDTIIDKKVSKKDTIMTIIGPCSCYIFRSSDLFVMLFGEQHTAIPEPKSREIIIDQYLDTIFKSNKDSFFDLYIEQSYNELVTQQEASSYRQSMKHGTRALTKMYENFSVCLSRIRHFSDKCDNLRVHAVDVRVTKLNSDKKYNTLDLLNIWTHYVLYELPIISQWAFEQGEKLYYTIRSMEKLAYPPLVKKSIDDIDTSIPEFKIGHEILSDIYNQGISTRELAKELGIFIDLMKEGDHHKMEIKIYDIIQILIPSMDIYALARVMTKYSKYPHNAKNIVIYTGDSHTQVYLDFFKTIGLKLTYSQACQKYTMVKVKAPPDELIKPLKREIKENPKDTNLIIKRKIIEEIKDLQKQGLKIKEALNSDGDLFGITFYITDDNKITLLLSPSELIVKHRGEILKHEDLLIKYPKLERLLSIINLLYAK